MVKERSWRRERGTGTWADSKMENGGAKGRRIGKWPMRRATCARFVTQRRLMPSFMTVVTFALAWTAQSRSRLVLSAGRTFDMWLGCTGLEMELDAANWTLVPADAHRYILEMGAGRWT